ncbi:MAG: hypothetical protein RLZZ165_14 [Bacteroidota bacterium]|jgi:hypothetical protein
MAIDYITQYKCGVKKDLDEKSIVHLVKSRNRAEALLQCFMEQGMTRVEAMNSKFGISSVSPSGKPEVEMVTVGSLFKQAELLDDHRDTCRGCAVGYGREFGCYDSINYPISEAAEIWLAEMAAQAIAAGLPNSILTKFILDENVTGETFSNMRKADETRYLEAKFPIEIEVDGDGDAPLLIDTNQIMEMFFAIGEMGDVHQQFLLFFSGGLTIEDEIPEGSTDGVNFQVAEVRNQNGPSRYWVFRLPDKLSDDRSIRQIKAFLRAVFLAYCSRSPISIDY